MPLSSWDKHAFVDLNAKMPKGKRVCAQKKAVLRMYNYFDSLEQLGGSRGELSRPSEATGEQTSYSKLRAGRNIYRFDITT